MKDPQAELERQVGRLTLEVARLRRSVVTGFVMTGGILVVSFINRDAAIGAAAIGVVLWAAAHAGAALGGVVSRRLRNRRSPGE